VETATIAAPLAGLRVLDLSRVLAGPLAAQTLADMGAEVIKVERPGMGDETRGFPPFSASGAYSSYFGSVNRGKRSVTVNIDTAEGREIVRELADRCDVLIENFKAGSLEKMGLDFAALSASNPRLIYCSITGFGQNGPHRHRAGYDVVIQAMGGLMSLTGESAGEPVKAGVAIADVTCALYAVSAILAALYERERSQVGQHIDLALLDVQIASLVNHGSSFLMTGKVPERHGNAHTSIVPYQVFETAKGSIVIACANDGQFEKVATIVGLPELANDPRYGTNAARVRNREELIFLIEERLRTRPAKEWMDDLEKAGVPAGPINYLDEVFADAQIEAHDLIAEYPSQDGPIRLVGNPIRFSRTPVVRDLPPPELGVHTDAILRDVLGKSVAEIEALRNRGAI
jgi:crotonobetainyl-CoA:carnitine CoA-transferase CaiB-like acyl-CoA transferase